MKVYIITSGSYSDYGIRTVFVDRAVAEQFVKEHSGEYDENNIEDWEGYDHIPERRSVYVIEAMPPYGTPREYTVHRWPWEELHFQGGEPKGDRPKVDEWTHGIRVYGNNDQTVRKAFYDRVAPIVAKRAGIA